MITSVAREYYDRAIAQRNALRSEIEDLKQANDELRALLAERHQFPDYPGPAEGQVSTAEDWDNQHSWREKWNDLNARIGEALEP